MRYIISLLLVLLACNVLAQQDSNAYVLVLGVAQDGGYPHAGCTKNCCKAAWNNKDMSRYVVSLALVDPRSNKWWLFEATPDITAQLHYFNELTSHKYNYLPDGIFITHGHIGHYIGLAQLGREVMNTKNIPVYVLSKMKVYLETNGPWSQLVQLKNIELKQLEPQLNAGARPTVNLSDGVSVEAFTVPHRDEYSETAGFRITTKAKKYLFIPDIDKWEKWGKNIQDEVRAVDIALLDGTFYENGEIPGRNMSEVPHPFVTETVSRFMQKSREMKSKIYFIHFNHTNPLLWDEQKQADVRIGGFNIAEQGGKL